MDAQERIIRRLFSEQSCHHCGRSYHPEGILVLARRKGAWMVMVSCASCEQKDMFVVKFPLQMQGRRRVTSYRLSKPVSSTPLPGEFQHNSETSPPPTPSTLVSVDDVLDMHEFLQHFNGDFQGLFAEDQ